MNTEEKFEAIQAHLKANPQASIMTTIAKFKVSRGGYYYWMGKRKGKTKLEKIYKKVSASPAVGEPSTKGNVVIIVAPADQVRQVLGGLS